MGLESTTKRPADSFKELDDLITKLKNNKVIPNSTIIQLETIQRSGNYGSHDCSPSAESGTESSREVTD
jgi:hypothetical protein